MEPRSRCVLVLSARSVPVRWDLFPISRLVVGFAGQQEGACSPEPGCGLLAWWDSQPSPPQPWYRVAAPCPVRLLKYRFHYFFSLFCRCHLFCWHSSSSWQGLPSAGAVAAGRARTWCSPGVVSSERRGAGDDAQDLKPARLGPPGGF